MKSGMAKSYGALFLTCTIWGTTWVVSKIGIGEMPALQMSAIRQFLAGFIFLIYFLGIRKEKFPSINDLIWSVGMGMLLFVFANGLSTWSLNFIPSGFSALIGALYPLCVVIIERIFFKVRMINFLTLFGLLLGLLGIIIVFYENAFHSINPHFYWGVGLSLIAMLSWSVGTVFVTRQKVEIGPYHATGWQMFFSGILLYLFSLAAHQHIPISEITLTSWKAIGYLVIFGSIITFIAFIYTIQTLPAAIASLYAYINPLVAMLLAALFLNEKLTTHILWGSVVTLIGVYLVNLSIKRAKAVASVPEQ